MIMIGKIGNKDGHFKILTKTKPMHQLITLTHPMKCAITGIQIDKGEQAYYNHETKNCIHPLEYESNMSKAKIGDPKTYFSRLSKLNTKNP